ncbi:MAG TPA: TadE/TadG family type IV pilus assembly protein [Myxococcota bacterium]|nr:TadE/TadG family type IV pilus assembly protein [Myxococcota bacterium]
MSPRSRRGAAAIETALVVPVVLLITLGLMDWSWLMYRWHTVEASAMRGVRLLGGDPDLGGLDERAREEVDAHLRAFGVDPADATVRAEVEERPYGPIVTVTVTVDVEPLIGVGHGRRQVVAVASGPWYAQ